ncbi:integrase core domain-containing protein [Bradyrhizobium symbiodeficiens]|uniref:integrase core domain-containing protein n=1 Tax=Bradyrhizobium symbiodeficiens TaxID=1404367 RepID=UPI003A5CC207
MAAWKDHYNNAWPHSALGNLTPTECADRSVLGPQRSRTLRYAEGSAPCPVAPPSPMGSNITRTPGLSPSQDEARGSNQRDAFSERHQSAGNKKWRPWAPL